MASETCCYPRSSAAPPPPRAGNGQTDEISLRALFIVASAIILGALLTRQGTSAQSLSYSKGQNASPAFEGWEENPDGSFNFLFGYMNRNWEEEIDLPVGPANTLDPGG